MKHRIRNYFLVLSLSVYGLGFSQTITLEPGSFPWYDDILSKTYNINCKLPVNFTDLKVNILRYIKMIMIGRHLMLIFRSFSQMIKNVF